MWKFGPLILKDPINITLGNDNTIYSAEIVSKHPEGLSASISYEESKVTLAPTLLNSKDSIIIRMLVRKSGSIKVDGRIAGITEIREISRETTTIPQMLALALGIIQAFAVTVMAFSVLHKGFPDYLWELLATSLIPLPFIYIIMKVRSRIR